MLKSVLKPLLMPCGTATAGFLNPARTVRVEDRPGVPTPCAVVGPAKPATESTELPIRGRQHERIDF